MKSAKLALNRWAMGQVLMPAHFQTLQDAILQHLGLRFELHGLPGYGVARLVWDDALLRKGAIAITVLTVVFPSGDLVDVPGNAVITNLNLSEFAGERADLYLHVSGTAADAEGLELYQDDPREVSRLIHRLELSTHPWLDQARQSMKLAELDRRADGDWELGPYIPPLLQVGTNPFLQALTQELFQTLTHLDAQLGGQLADAFLGGEHVTRLRRAQVAVHRLRAFLADSENQIHLHPYFFLSSLRELYLEACLLQNLAPQPSPVVYDHDALASCFGQMRRLLMERLRLAPASSARLAFTRDGHRFVAGPFPEGLTRAREVYLVIQHAMGEPPNLDEVKLASPTRLDIVHVNALTGVAFHKLAGPGFAHTFGPGADLYRLELGEEWQQAVRESALAFYARPHLTHLSAALSWRA
ncbi:type VI secretion system baseplate subunit TssK [Haliangium sp.]|uniref:type VI secretion system baseplate subunit TssK n=1 Tax=Haliangium sp. TaxID=2663208 RepID=UPI003D0FBF42